MSKNTVNVYEQYIKQINRSNKIRSTVKILIPILVLVAVVAWISGRVCYNRGFEAGSVAAVVAVGDCEADGGSGYYVGDRGLVRCLYD